MAGVQRIAFTATSQDGTSLAAVAYVPQAPPPGADGAPARWPLVVLLQDWGGSKADVEGGAVAATGVPPMDATNVLRSLALDGFVAVAYDARGFGQSGGQTTVAGPAEQMDLHAVVARANDLFPTNGRLGVSGQGYGGGEALQAWADDAGVDAVAAQSGWTDLYAGLWPGNVPKLEWAQQLYATGLAQSQGRYSPMVHRWYADVAARSGLATLRLEMQARSILARGSPRPLYLCQGIGETLTPQIDLELATAQAHGAFVRALVVPGGHGPTTDECWRGVRSFFAYTLGGRDTHVDAWPILSTVDAAVPGRANYSVLPPGTVASYVPRGSKLLADGGTSTFTVRQDAVSNPLGDPTVVSDQGGGTGALPGGLRTDPSASTFTTAGLAAPRTLFGDAVLHLRPDNASFPFQVAAQLQLVASDGSVRVLGHAAFAAQAASDLDDGTATLLFPWTKASLVRGDALRIVVGANDPDAFMPYPAAYTVTFTGANRLDVPWLDIAARPGV